MHPLPAKPTPKQFADSVAGKRCPICLGRVEIQSAASIIPCTHVYCVRCIHKWSDVKRNCPLCNANVTSWFRASDDFRIFREEKLPPPLDRSKQVIRRDDEALRRWRAELFERRRLIGRSRRASNRQCQAKVLPRQRSFIRETREVIAERVKRWRASIYERRMQAVPPGSRNSLVQKIVGNDGAKELLVRRIEPWIQRELQSVIGDPDPTIIVHVVTSLFVSLHKKKIDNFPRQGAQNDELAPLRPFLCEHTELFWHELSCFAGSSFSMETYDTVVVYRRMD